MAASAATRPAGYFPVQRSLWGATPEIYFAKPIDNSRLVRVVDRERTREMLMLGMALAALFVLVMLYAWQHFSALEYGYQNEALKNQRDGLVELNRALRLEEASLRDPERIDVLAQRMGLETPRAGQVVNLDAPAADLGAPVLARVSEALPAVR